MFAANGEERTRELLEWQYRSHLSGAHLCIAHTRAGLFEQPVAMYTAFPTRFRTPSGDGIAYQSFDTLTLKQFRGRGLFVRLAERLYEHMAGDGVQIVYGIPNGASFGGFVNHLGWSSLDPFPLMMRFVGSRYIRVRTRLRSPRISSDRYEMLGDLVEVSELSDGVSQLFEKSLHADRIGVIRDGHYLSWRLKRPGNTYRIVESRANDGETTGVVIVEIRAKHGCSVGYIMDLVVDREHPEHSPALLDAAIGMLRRSGADVILAWSMPSNPHQSDLRRHGFFRLPTSLSPNELHLGYRALNDNRLLHRERWNFSYLDSDTV
jgi:GNAT superfamily N-acetyltransferase